MVHDEGVDPSYTDRVTAPRADQKIEDSERARIVWAAVRSLSIKYRVPLVLFHYEGLSYNEIAESMGLSLSAVETRIHRAKKQLIKKLEPWAGENLGGVSWLIQNIMQESIPPRCPKLQKSKGRRSRPLRRLRANRLIEHNLQPWRTL